MVGLTVTLRANSFPELIKKFAKAIDIEEGYIFPAKNRDLYMDGITLSIRCDGGKWLTCGHQGIEEAAGKIYHLKNKEPKEGFLLFMHFHT